MPYIRAFCRGKQQCRYRVAWVSAAIVRRTANAHSLHSRTNRKRTPNNNKQSHTTFVFPTKSPDWEWLVVAEKGRCNPWKNRISSTTMKLRKSLVKPVTRQNNIELFGSSTRDRHARRIWCYSLNIRRYASSCMTISGGRTEQHVVIGSMFNVSIHISVILLFSSPNTTDLKHYLLFPDPQPGKDRIRLVQPEIWSLLHPQNNGSTSFFLTFDLRCHTTFGHIHINWSLIHMLIRLAILWWNWKASKREWRTGQRTNSFPNTLPYCCRCFRRRQFVC